MGPRDAATFVAAPARFRLVYAPGGAGMTRPTYDIHVDGVDAQDLPLGLLRDLCDILLEGAQRAAHLAFEGRSTGRGPFPGRIADLGDVRVVAYQRGSLDLMVNAPTLHEAAADLIAQQNMFSDLLSPDVTAVDLFLEAASDAVAGRQDSERLDAGMLEVLARTHGLFARGVTGLSFKGPAGTLTIGAMHAENIKRLRDQTPEPRMTRIQGVLDSVTVSTKSFTLQLEGKVTLRGLVASLAPELLAAHLVRSVVVEGYLYFKPSGQPLRIEADYIAAAQPGDELWARVPRAEVTHRPSVMPTADIGVVYGQWPGDETEEQIFAVLEQLS